jgi:hypothetical protein
VNRDLARYFEMLVSGDARPAERLRASVVESCQAPFAPMAVPETPSCMP